MMMQDAAENDAAQSKVMPSEIAAAGQSPRLGTSRLVDHARRLQATARDVAILAEAATVVASLDVDRKGPGRR